MTAKKALFYGQELTLAFQVLMQNDVDKGGQLAPVTVEFRDLKNDCGTRVFTYRVKWSEPRGGTRFDLKALAAEIEKIIPSVRVTREFCFFSVPYISLEAKELGRKGTYRFNFTEVRT